MVLSVHKKFSEAEKAEAVAYVQRVCPDEYEWLKAAELIGKPVEFEEREQKFAKFYAALCDGGFSKSLSEGTTLVFAVRVAARSEV